MRGLTAFPDFSLPEFMAASLRSFSGLPSDFWDDELRSLILQFYQQYVESSSRTFRDDISEDTSMASVFDSSPALLALIQARSLMPELASFRDIISNTQHKPPT